MDHINSDEEVETEEHIVFRHKTLTYWFRELKNNNPDAEKYIDTMSKVLMLTTDEDLTEENLNAPLLERLSFRSAILALQNDDLKHTADVMEISLQDMLDDQNITDWDPLKSQA